MNRGAKFWVSMAIFQVAFGFAVFAITRDYYKVENVPTESNVETTVAAADRFSSIDASLLDSLGSNSAFPQDPIEISRRANEYFANKQYDKAANLYEKLLAMDPGNVDTLNNLGLTLHYIGRSEEALQKLNEGVAVDPDYQRIWLTLGFVNSSLGNTAAAHEALSTAADMDPDSEVGRSASQMLENLAGG